MRPRYKRSVIRVRASVSHFLGMLCTLLGLALVTFLIGREMPIDPVAAIVGDKAPPDVIAQTRLELGLDKPLVEQFYIYAKHLLHGDLGTSVMTGQSVVGDILTFFPATLELATAAMLLATIFGVPLGVIAASRRGSIFDSLVRTFSLVGQSVPIFVIGLAALLVFYAKLNIAPGIGQQDVGFEGLVPSRTGMIVVDAALSGQWDAFSDALNHLVMPALLLAFVSLSTIARMTRTLMLEALSGEYIVAARAKGLSATRILWKHAFGNVSGRLFTVLVLAYASLLEGAVLTETVFSWPGLGLYLTRSLLRADMNAVLGATIVIGVVYVALNFLADLANRILDPRVL